MQQTDSMAAALLELARDWGISLADFSGPVSDEEIDAAQRELGVVFPNSYRVFLHYFGAGCLHHYEIYGIPIDRLWGDVVTMNRLEDASRPNHLVKFTGNVGDFSFYLDTSRMRPDGECPVIALGPGEEPGGSVVAESFLDFLCQAREGSI